MIKWELRNGKIVSDKKMTQMKNNRADYYEGKVKSIYGMYCNNPNKRLADRLRLMSNSEYVRTFGVASRKIIK